MNTDQLNPPQPEKVDITRVVMRRVHGVCSQARVNSLEAANAVLAQWASDVAISDDIQCDVQILFQDGFQYRGPYPLTKSRRRLSLGVHVRRQLAALAGKCGNAKNMPPANEPVISPIGRTRAESARIALEHYNF